MIEADHFCQRIGEIAVRAMLYEVAATPKPGLVDRDNSGAHGDMDFFTFMASTAALEHTFYNCTKVVIESDWKEYGELLPLIRPIGILGEERMFHATKGVNTHKGMNFSLGVIAGAVGSIYRETLKEYISAEEVCHRVIQMTKGITKRELTSNQNKDSLTYGEMLFEKYGIKGIRGEVESGFITVRDCGLRILRDLIKDEKKQLNDVLVQVLLHLMTVTEDSNVLGRHDMVVLDYVKKRAKEALRLGGIFSEKGKEYILKMDKDFIERNISPGGSADLLGVTLFLYYIESRKDY